MILDRFREVANQHWDELAIVDNGERITFGRLAGEAARHRTWLKAALDPQPGDVIAITMLNCWQFVACILALSDLRAVIMPCNPQWRGQELRELATRIAFRGVVAARQFHSEWELAGGVPGGHLASIEDALKCDADLTNPHAAARGSLEDPALYLATSGSTGRPRIVPLSNRNLLAATRNGALGMRLAPTDRILSVVPYYHLHGFNNGLLTPLLKGASVVIMRHFAPEEYAELAAREGVNVLIGSPFIFSHLTDRVSNRGLFERARLCISSGARLPPAVGYRWKERFGSAIIQWYGTSETSGIAIASAPREPSPELGGEYVGVRLPSVEVRCLDSEGNDVGVNRLGEIAVRSQAVMPGYLGESELNQRLFRDGFFRTGDLGYLDSEGGLYLKGRIGRLINMGGLKVDPVEVERAVEALPAVAAVHVDAVSGGRAGEVIRARVVVRPGLSLTRADVIEQCRNMLSEYKLPRIIEFVDSLPVTVAGKIPQNMSPSAG